MVVMTKAEFHGRAGRVHHPATLLHHRHPRLHPGLLMISLWSFQVVQTLHNKLYKSRGKTHWEVRTDEGKKLVESWGAIFLKSSAKESQVTVGIFMKLTEENNQVDNSCGRCTSCHLM
ncbi:hypothetical protein Nmel_018921 [Mimus melanotis]